MAGGRTAGAGAETTTEAGHNTRGAEMSMNPANVVAFRNGLLSRITKLEKIWGNTGGGPTVATALGELREYANQLGASMSA